MGVVCELIFSNKIVTKEPQVESIPTLQKRNPKERTAVKGFGIASSFHDTLSGVVFSYRTGACTSVYVICTEVNMSSSN